jgi:two-component system, sporulation sensor kinase E
MSVSPNKSAEDRLQDREQLSMMAQLAGSVAHAIHNPLTSIFLHADILEDDLRQLQGENSAQSLDYLNLIREEITRVQDLVEEYLLLARLSILPREAEDLGVFLESFVLGRREYLETHGISLQLEGSHKAGLVAMHQQAFTRALLNVIEHAVEAIPDGGAISLQAQHTEAEIQLTIRHTGDGPSTGQPSQPVTAAGWNKPGQMGLGLCLAKEIVAAHGGTLEVDKEPITGTTYRVTLPPLASKPS